MSETSMATDVWNPIAGCSIVSAGCKNCYAMRMAARLEAMGQAKYAGLTESVNGHTVWTGKVNLDYAALGQPAKWKKPKHVFVNSMSDLFHENVSSEFVARMFDVMSQEPQHTFMILTKRPARMLEFVTRYSDVLLNVWLGVSVEDQRAADERIPPLLQTPAAVRFLSCEPLLGPVDLSRYLTCEWYSETLPTKARGIGFPETSEYARIRPSVDWVIVGGESGPGARPMSPDWARSLRDQCRNAGVPFFFKQWGGVHKKDAGRLLDGREWNDYPE